MKNTSTHILYSPSDLSAHSSCKHLTQLNKQNVRGEITDPEIYPNPVLQMLKDKGIRFEASHRQKLIDQGLQVVTISNEDPDAEKKTIDAMKAGVDVIYQGRLKEEVGNTTQ